MQITHCKTNHMTNPMGFAMEYPVFSYVVENADGKKQICGKIRISDSKTMENVLFDSGWDAQMDSLAYPVRIELKPCTRYYWQVQIRTDAGEEGTSEIQWFETGKRNEKWEGKWICCSNDNPRHPVFKRQINIAEPVRQARLYICGLGLYEAYFNEKRIGEEYLTPYCNNYNAWKQYQTYDITENLQETGELRVLLGNGWYKGRFGFSSKIGGEGYYGNKWQLIAEIHILYESGRTEIIGTDESWEVERSQIVASSIYDGEYVDGTLVRENGIEMAVLTEEKLFPTERYSIPVKVQKELVPVAVIETQAGELVLDLGQNQSGIFKLKVHEPKGTKIYLQFGEVLQNGCFYRENLRSALADYSWISDGKPTELMPHFTFYGYRYVKVEGIRNLKKEDFTALVLCSDLPQTGRLVTGHELVNRLILNAEWGLCSNFLDVPTDCPQRDERMGWTGDAQVFSGTACFQHDAYAFYRKYLHDIASEQMEHAGMVPDVVPSFGLDSCASVWGDAACIIPWNLYLFYGDISILQEQYESMKAWVDYIIKVDGDNHGWRKVFHYGDWLALDHPSGKPEEMLGGTDEAFIADVYYRQSAEIVANTAKLLEYKDDAERYKKLADKLRKEIRREYYSETGRCCINTQTAAILSLRDHLCENEERTKEQLVRLIKVRNGKLTTGFVGTPFLCLILSEIGETDLAYKLLLNEDYPGWLYAVKLGATTIWERWNSILPDGAISSTGMNSLNHYSYGSIVEWIWRKAVGLNPMEHSPGFRKVSITPEVNCKLGSINAEYHSPCGEYQIGWEVLDNTHICLKLKIPFGANAELKLPLADEHTCQMNRNNPIFANYEDGKCMLKSGIYEITYETCRPLRRRYSVDDAFLTLIEEEDCRKILTKNMSLEGIPPQYREMPLRELLEKLQIAGREELLVKIENEFLYMESAADEKEL